MGIYAKLPAIYYRGSYYDVECSVDLDVEMNGEFAQDFEFDVTAWAFTRNSGHRFTEPDFVADGLYERINQSEALRATLRLRAIDNYDPTE